MYEENLSATIVKCSVIIGLLRQRSVIIGLLRQRSVIIGLNRQRLGTISFDVQTRFSRIAFHYRHHVHLQTRAGGEVFGSRLMREGGQLEQWPDRGVQERIR